MFGHLVLKLHLAIAEMLHRPLYSVTVGELGTNAKDLEASLSIILELAATWNAVLLIDEVRRDFHTEHGVFINTKQG